MGSWVNVSESWYESPNVVYVDSEGGMALVLSSVKRNVS